MKNVDVSGDSELVEEIADIVISSQNPAALTGAGISVGSGIPDFRSSGGLWTKFSPDAYATLDIFMRNPEKAWKLYRALGKVLEGKKPNKAHFALADLEKRGKLNGIITQNVDGLHQMAGNTTVLEIHGDHQHLECIRCGFCEPVRQEHFLDEALPSCRDCNYPLKPNVVLFGEPVRNMDGIEILIRDCDLLLVAGTSAQVYPAAGLPYEVKRNGGTVIEFNKEHALGGVGFQRDAEIVDYFFRGDVEQTLPALADAMKKENR